jgi:hypothetical protein
MKKTLIIFTLCLWAFLSFGQNFADSTKSKTDSLKFTFSDSPIVKYLPNFSSLTPNAAAMQKYGELPVNLATGLPEISVPIFNVKQGDLSLPISLQYHAGGHKLGEKASWVGWGWSLNAGGGINRRVMGMPDDVDGATGINYLNNPIAENLNLCNNSVDFDYANQVSNYAGDAEADIYSFSFPGGSGRFILGQNGLQPMLIPYQPFKISTTGSPINNLKIINEYGVAYDYGGAAVETQQEVNGRWNKNYISTWFLNAIKAPNTNDQITLNYQNGGATFSQDRQWTANLLGEADGIYQNATGTEAKPNTSSAQGSIMHLQNILFENGEVEFIQSNQNELREDMPSSSYLKQINIYNYENEVKTLQKQVVFIYSYFKDINNQNGRLKLDKVEFRDNKNNIIEAYNFDYFTNQYSWRDTEDYFTQKDYFGYFNGAASNQSLITLAAYNVGNTTVPIDKGGANRLTNEAYLKEGVLQKITYPIRGFTEFEFEPHQYQYNAQNYLAGGLRVKKIKSIADSTSKPIIKSYTYGSDLGENLGKLITSWYPGSENVAIKEYLRYKDNSGFSSNATRFIINQNSPLEIGGLEASPVYYTDVKEYFEDIGDSLKNGHL